MSTFDEDEASVEDSTPREGVVISYPVATYRIAIGDQDLVIDGNTYTATTSDRDALSASMSGDSQDMVLNIPCSHPIVKRWFANGVPPRLVTAVLYRKQAGGESRRMFGGSVMGVSVNDHMASLQIKTKLSQIATIRIPVITAGRDCPHVLYDDNCRVDREDFVVDSTIVHVAGRVVTVASMGAHPDSWAKYGEFWHTFSGEKVSISEHSGNTLTLQYGLNSMKEGQAVKVFAGCGRNFLDDCVAKFSNPHNFGGFPNLPIKNPMKWRIFTIR